MNAPPSPAALAGLSLKHRQFVANLFRGMSATQSYLAVYGCTPASAQANGSKLFRKPHIAAAVAACEAEHAWRCRFTYADADAELNEAKRIATERGDASALVAVTEVRARLHGLIGAAA